MPILTKSFALVSGAIVATIASSAVLAIHYNSPITQHLVDVVSGNQTQTVDVENAPNWGQGIALFPVPQRAIATTSAGSIGSLSSSTAFTFGVAACDDDDCTVVNTSQTISTDASSTLLPNEAILVKWAPVIGAQGYRVFFATGTVATFTQYFNATNTTSFVFGTSTGSLSANANTDESRAFATLIRPNGTSFFNGNNGTATTTSASTTALHVNGNIDAISNATTSACFAATAGQVFFNTANHHEWGCDGTSWNKIF